MIIWNYQVIHYTVYVSCFPINMVWRSTVTCYLWFLHSLGTGQEPLQSHRTRNSEPSNPLLTRTLESLVYLWGSRTAAFLSSADWWLTTLNLLGFVHRIRNESHKRIQSGFLHMIVLFIRNIAELYFSLRDAAFTIFSEICEHRLCFMQFNLAVICWKCYEEDSKERD